MATPASLGPSSKPRRRIRPGSIVAGLLAGFVVSLVPTFFIALMSPGGNFREARIRRGKADLREAVEAAQRDSSGRMIVLANDSPNWLVPGGGFRSYAIVPLVSRDGAAAYEIYAVNDVLGDPTLRVRVDGGQFTVEEVGPFAEGAP